MRNKIFAGVLVLVCFAGAAAAGWAIAEPAHKPRMSDVSVPRLHPRVVNRTIHKVKVVRVRRPARSSAGQMSSAPSSDSAASQAPTSGFSDSGSHRKSDGAPKVQGGAGTGESKSEEHPEDEENSDEDDKREGGYEHEFGDD